jgi:palmitoyltransferase ZDHHC9/14/18
MVRTTIYDLHHRQGRCLCVKYGKSYLFKLPFSRKIFVIGPHWIGVVITIGVIFGGTIINLKIISKFGGTFQAQLVWFSYIMTVLTTFLLLTTALTDPGIVFPSEAVSDENEEEGSLIKETNKNTSNKIYCELCHIYCSEDMKVGHCTDCGYCIEKLDHHCPWMGQCVGKKNMM